MESNVLYERDLLYPTESLYEPGIFHLEIMNPDSSGKMPVVIEGRSSHSPVGHIDEIIRIMQSDVFDRIHIEVKKNVSLYISIRNNEELLKQHAGCPYLKVCFGDDGIKYQPINAIMQ